MKKSTNEMIVTVTVTEEMIAACAYQRYADRGGEDGHDVEDWFAAEQELRPSAGTQPAATEASQRTARVAAAVTPARP